MDSPRSSQSSWRRWFTRGFLLLLALAAALFLLLVAAPALFGYPQAFRQMLTDSFTPEGGSCRIRAMQGNLITGLELNDVEVEFLLPQGKGGLLLPTAHLSFRPLPLLRGKFIPREITFTEGEAVLSLKDPASEEETLLGFSPLSGQFLLTLPQTLLAQLEGNLEGQRLSLQVRLTDLDATEDPLKTLATLLPSLQEPKAPPVPQTAEASSDVAEASSDVAEASQEPGASLVQSLPASGLLFRLPELLRRAGDTSLSLRLTGSLREPETLALAGQVAMSNGEILGRNISRAQGKFRLFQSIFSLEELHITYNAREFLHCQGQADLLARTIQGEVQATCMPRTILWLAGLSPSLLPPWVLFSNPLDFQGTLPPTSWDLRAPQPTLSFSTQDLRLRNLLLPQVSGTLTLQQKNLLLQDLQLTFAPEGWEDKTPHSLQGEMLFALKDQTFQGSLEGDLNVRDLLHKLELLENRDTPLEAFSDAHLTLAIAPSPWKDWRRWNATLSLGQPRSTLGKFPLTDLELKGSTRDGLLTLDATSHLGDSNATRISLHLETAHPQGADAPLALQIHPKITQGEEEALSARITLLWTPEESTLQIPQGELLLRPELLFPLLKAPLSLPENFLLGWFQCQDPEKPARFTFIMPRHPMLNPRDSWDWEKLPWQLEGSVEMPRMKMKQILFDSISADFHLTETQLLFSHLEGILPESRGTMSANLKILFRPFHIIFDNLRLNGPPLSFRNLLHAPGAIRIYDRIWESFQWPEPPDPQEEHCLLQIPLLEYREYEGDKWGLTLQGTVDVCHFQYRGLPLDSLHAKVDLKLPENGLTVTDILLRQAPGEEGALKGTLSMDFRQGIQGVFHGEKQSGTFPTLQLLACLLYQNPDALKDFSLPPEANFTCEGRFFQGVPDALSLEGTLETPALRYQNIHLQNLQGKWKFHNNRIIWDVPSAEFFQGTLATTGFYDRALQKIEFHATAQGIPLAQLLKLSRGKLLDPENTPEDLKYALDKLPGKLDAEGHFVLLKDWGGIPLHLEGSGNLHLHEMDLWRIPTLTTLGKIISRGTFQFFSKDKIASLGKISTLDADFNCRGSAIAFQDIRTDGSFLALRGEGLYRLNDNQMNFQVSGQLLKSVSLLSWLLRPISWAFNAELTGTPQEHQWKLRSTLRNLFGTH